MPGENRTFTARVDPVSPPWAWRPDRAPGNLVEAPGTAPGSATLISNDVYRHSRLPDTSNIVALRALEKGASDPIRNISAGMSPLSALRSCSRTAIRRVSTADGGPDLRLAGPAVPDPHQDARGLRQGAAASTARRPALALPGHRETLQCPQQCAQRHGCASSRKATDGVERRTERRDRIAEAPALRYPSGDGAGARGDSLRADARARPRVRARRRLHGRRRRGRSGGPGVLWQGDAKRARRCRAHQLSHAPPPHDAVRDVRDQVPREASHLRRAPMDPAPHRQRQRVLGALFDPRQGVLRAAARAPGRPVEKQPPGPRRGPRRRRGRESARPFEKRRRALPCPLRGDAQRGRGRRDTGPDAAAAWRANSRAST